MKLDYAALSDTGQVRENNEDFYGAVIPDAPGAQMSCDALFVVADGMGGHRGGEIASKLAVETIIESYHSSEHADKADLLREALTSANRAIVDSSVADTALFGMGTTCTAMMISDDTAYFGHVGDSRAYRVRAGEIKQISEDHSLVGEMVRSGIISDEDARSHPKRNVITRSLGSQASVLVDTPETPMTLHAGDMFVLCSDGLTSCVSDAEIMSLVKTGNTETACRELINLANSRGGRDNITVQIVRVLE